MTNKRVHDRQRRLRQALTPATRALPIVGLADARQILQHEANQPLRGASSDMQHDGLFGDAHLQREMFK